MMKQVCWHSRRSKAYRGLPEARIVASRLLRMYWSSRGLPRLLLAPFTASFYLVPVRLLVQFRLQGLVGCCSRFCCCLAAISLIWLLGVSWWLVSGWTWCWGRISVPCGLDLKSQSLVIESFSVGSRAVLSTMGEGLAAAGSKSFMALVSRVSNFGVAGQTV